MGMSTGGNNRGVMGEINVTPFVDVMLVLLVIFWCGVAWHGSAVLVGAAVAGCLLGTHGEGWWPWLIPTLATFAGCGLLLTNRSAPPATG